MNWGRAPTIEQTFMRILTASFGIAMFSYRDMVLIYDPDTAPPSDLQNLKSPGGLTPPVTKRTRAACYVFTLLQGAESDDLLSRHTGPHQTALNLLGISHVSNQNGVKIPVRQ